MPGYSGKEADMTRLVAVIFIVAFAVVTGSIVVALLTMNLSEPVHFFAAAGAGAVIAAIASVMISKNINA